MNTNLLLFPVTDEKMKIHLYQHQNWRLWGPNHFQNLLEKIFNTIFNLGLITEATVIGSISNYDYTNEHLYKTPHNKNG